MRITIDPTDLLPGDIVVSIGDHDISGCHCDVTVTVDRADPEPLPPLCYHCNAQSVPGSLAVKHERNCKVVIEALERSGRGSEIIFREQSDELMKETEEAIADAEADMGEELVDSGGWVDVVRSIVSMSDKPVDVKVDVLRRHGLERRDL